MSSVLPITINSTYLATAYNYDFTKERDDGKVYWRGKYNGKPLQYHRPYGWYRHALDVSGKYPGGDSWLGTNGIRTNSTDSEWPIAYHGTKAENVPGIVKEGFRPGAGAFGFGVYSCPNLSHVESTYALDLKKGGNTYKIVLQVRVNPDKYHLNMYEDARGKGITYWLSTKQDLNNGVYDVRPYGILVKLTETSSGSGCSVM